MDEKKSFFDSLEPKSALVVGVAAGFMGLCTIGFFILGAIMLKGGVGDFGGNASAYGNDVIQPSGQIATPQAEPQPVNVPKSDKPQVELFVMSHCPYGLQAQKAYTPVAELLGKKTNMSVKFVSYIMHGQPEKDDNNLEYCIQKEQNDKYLTFLKCYTASGDAQACLGSAGVNKSKLNSCINNADKQFKISEEFANRANWLSGQYPRYLVHQKENDAYGVQGSPTLVVNGTQVEFSRSPEGLKQVICGAFNNPPEECKQTLSTAQAAPGFGTAQAAANGTPAGAGCGV